MAVTIHQPAQMIQKLFIRDAASVLVQTHG
jgi:hypothetical protein